MVEDGLQQFSILFLMLNFPFYFNSLIVRPDTLFLFSTMILVRASVHLILF